MKVPKRLYYPFSELAKELGCSLEYIYHLAGTELIQPSIYIPSGFISSSSGISIFPSEKVDINAMLDEEAIYGDGWSIHGIKKRDDSESEYTASDASGFFYIPGSEILECEFDINKKSFRTMGLDSSPYIEGPLSTTVTFSLIDFPTKYLCIMSSELHKLQKSSIPEMPDVKESPKTIAKKSQLFTSLIQLIPEMDGVDLISTPVNKIIELIETIAASKGVDLPEAHRQTWQTYLGRR